MSPLWSWLLTIVGVTGLFLAGSGRRAGWAVGFCGQGLWITYAIVTRQYGFVVASLCYGVVFARNWTRAGRRPRGDA